MLTTADCLQTLYAFAGSLGFGIIFRLRGKKLIFAALGGGLTWLLYLLLRNFLPNDFSCCFLASCFGAGYSEILARILKAPTTIFTMPAVIPLVPGGNLYRAMSGLISGDQDLFTQQGETALRTSFAIAVGILLVLIISNSVVAFFRASRASRTKRI